MNKNDEMILAIKKDTLNQADLIDDMLAKDVLKPVDDVDYKYMVEILNKVWEDGGVVKRRGDLEEDTNYLQPIPSILIKRGQEYFAYKRLGGSGEKRLHNMVSTTVGGHANQCEYPWNFEHLMAVNGSRELEEEVIILDSKGKEINNHYELMKESKILGLTYTDETEVDSVHLAVFYMVEIPEDWEVKVKETDVLDGKFEKLEDIKQMNLETWSRDIIDSLEG